MVRILNHVFYPLFVPPLLEQSLARSGDALVRAERVGDPVLFFFAADWRALAVACAGDIDEFDRYVEIAGSLAAQLNQPFSNWVHTFRRATRAQIAGDTDQAEQLATEALQIGTDGGEPDATIFFGWQLAMVSWQRGTLSELVPLIEQLADTPDLTPALTAGSLAWAHVEGDHFDDARHLLEQFGAAEFDLPLDGPWLYGMVAYAEAAIACRDPDYAGPLFDRLAPWADQLSYPGPTAQCPVSHYLGGLATVLGRYDEADAYFSQAAVMSQRMGAKFFAALTDLMWGKMLAERQAPGDTEKARDLLTKARTAAVAHGYGGVERRAAAALQGLG